MHFLPDIFIFVEITCILNTFLHTFKYIFKNAFQREPREVLLCLITRSKILKSCKSPFHNLLCSILIWNVFHSKPSWIYKGFFTRSKHSWNLRVSISISCPRSLQEIEFIYLKYNFFSSKYRCLLFFFILFYFSFFHFSSFHFLLLSFPHFYFVFFCFYFISKAQSKNLT